MDIHSLDGVVQAYFTAGLTESSHRTYGTAEKRYRKFCQDFSLYPFPTNENILCYFVACLGQQGLALATIKTYLSGVRQAQIRGGLPDPNVQAMPRLRQVLRGVEIMRGRLGKTPRLRLPITPSILRKMKGVWAMEREYERSLWWAVALTAFFGFCRSGEITVPQGRAYDPQVHLSLRDVSVDKSHHPDVISLLLRCSKTDQERRGVKVILGRTNADLCPVSALLSYLVHRGRSPGALFMVDGQPLERTRLVEEVRRALSRAGLPAGSFAGHSFRIGAATTASAVGVEDSTIQALGRWKSSAFKLYVHPSASHLAGVSRSLAQCNL